MSQCVAVYGYKGRARFMLGGPALARLVEAEAAAYLTADRNLRPLHTLSTARSTYEGDMLAA